MKDRTVMRADLRTDLKDSGALWSDSELNRCIEKAVADTEVRCDEKEIGMLNKHGKSVVSREPIRAGTVITADMLTVKSPGYGIRPAFLPTLIGKTAKTDIPEDSVIVEDFIA